MIKLPKNFKYLGGGGFSRVSSSENLPACNMLYDILITTT
jgi:hypothetical protein